MHQLTELCCRPVGVEAACSYFSDLKEDKTQLYRVIYARQVCFFKQGVSVLESNTTNTAELLQKHGSTLNISRPQILRK